MAASHEHIHGWLLRGQTEGATHVLIVCDTFDWTNYPVYVYPDEQVQTKVNQYDGKDMQRIMEVYNLALDIETQLGKGRVWNL